MTKTMAATKPRRRLARLALALPVAFGWYGLAHAAETRPLVEINLDALKSAGTGAASPAPKRIVDGETVIILVPPSLQIKANAPVSLKKIATPQVKPAIALPPVKTAKAVPAPLPRINPAKMPPAEKTDKFDAVAVPVSEMNTAPLPTPAQAEVIKDTVAESAAEKVTDVTPAAKPEPAPEISAEKLPETEVQVAAVPPDPLPKIGTASPQKLSRILFAEGETEMSDASNEALQAIADQLADGGRQSVQLLAYGTGNSVSAARRLSLGRALVVRSKLMELGVENRKIEVRALGTPEGDDPADRVDLVLIAR
jgi:outer membrane protein OmpA-like peptidoglycan-associated protein